jgi:hypothetical protein
MIILLEFKAGTVCLDYAILVVELYVENANKKAIFVQAIFISLKL